jgi:hypothetical protein
MADAPRKKQHNIEFIAIAGLVLVALIMGIARFRKAGADDEVFSRKEYDRKWKEVEVLETEAPKKEKGIVYTLEDDKAPFKSPFDEIDVDKEDAEIVVLPDMKFQGMVWKSQRPQAIINNKVYDIKDIIKLDEAGVLGEIKVKDIDKDGIHLMYKGREFIVRPK